MKAGGHPPVCDLFGSSQGKHESSDAKLSPAMSIARIFAAVLMAIFFSVFAHAQSAEPYARKDSWLCRPGRADACAANEDATIVAADGKLTLEPFRADPIAPIDCFYVYPTVSNEISGNADLAIGPEQRRAAAQQFARFGARCRLFAPMYRQFTLKALRAAAGPHPIPYDRELGYRDVAAAWRNYLAHDNHGRGFVLIGHSQGSGVLAELIRDEIDGKPIQAQLVSAILMGTSLPVPADDDIGGAFKHIPVCRSNDQTGCVIAFSSFRVQSPPPAGSLFVQTPAGMRSACANPAALAGGAGTLDAYLSTNIATVIGDVGPHRAWTRPSRPIATPFVRVPGLLSAECVADAHGAYLAVTTHPAPGGGRVNDIAGDVIIDGKARPEWGLHLIDANLAIGNLIAIVGEETRAYLAKGRN
jgi:Protein of unknown function (DUF3089)